MRKIKQRVLAIFLTVMMLVGMLPAVHAAEASTVSRSIIVTGVYGIDGQLSYENAGAAASIQCSPVTSMSGSIENDHVVYASDGAADFTLNITFVFAADAQEGATCTVGFTYRVMDEDGNWSDVLYASAAAVAPAKADDNLNDDKDSPAEEEPGDDQDEEIVDEEIVDENANDEELADEEDKDVDENDDEASEEDEDISDDNADEDDSEEDEDLADDEEDAKDESDEDESDEEEADDEINENAEDDDDDADSEDEDDAESEDDDDADVNDDEDDADDENDEDADEADDSDDSDADDEESDGDIAEEDDKAAEDDKSDDVDDDDELKGEDLDDEDEQDVDDEDMDSEDADDGSDDADEDEAGSEDADEDENDGDDELNEEPDEDGDADDQELDGDETPGEDDSDEDIDDADAEEDDDADADDSDDELMLDMSLEEDHQCEVCEKYNSELPDDEFKQCFDCEGEHWYCEEHFDDHEHLDADGNPIVNVEPADDDPDEEEPPEDDPDEEEPPEDDPPEVDPVDTPTEDEDPEDEPTDPVDQPPVDTIPSTEPSEPEDEDEDDQDPTDPGSVVDPSEEEPEPSDEPAPGTDPGSIVMPPEDGPQPADPDDPASDTPAPADSSPHAGGGTPIWTYTPPHGSEIQLFYVNPAIREQIHLDATLADIARHELEAEDSKEEKLAPDVIKYNNWFYGVEDATSVYDYDEKIEPHNWNTAFVVWCANQLSYIDFNRFPMTNDSVELFDWLCAVEENNLISINEALSTTDDVEVVPGDLVFIEKKDGYLVGIVTEIDVEEHMIKMIFGDHHRAVEEIELDMFELPSSTKFIHIYVPDYTLSAIASYLIRELEIPPAAAAGILANIRCESNFNTQSIGDGGTSYGICQWHNGRWDNLVAYCNSEDISWATMEGQLMFLKYEVETGYQDMLQSFRECENNDESAYDAAVMFSLCFERPAGQEASASVRGYLASRNMFPTIMRIVEEEEDEEVVEEVNEENEAADANGIELSGRMLVKLDDDSASDTNEKTSAPVSSIVNASAQNILENKLNQNVYASVVYATSSSNGF